MIQLEPKCPLPRPVLRHAAESPIRTMLALAGKPGMISLAGGHPDPQLLPRDWLVEAARQVVERLRGQDLQYGATEGVPALRESMCALLASRRIIARPDEVVVTTGSQQAISLLVTALVEAGDQIAMAPFNYPGAVQAVRFAGAEMVTVSDDAEGFAELMAGPSAERIKALYLVPSFANPTGHVIGLEARLRILQVAAHHGVLVIEDDPYAELWFERAPPDSLYALNQAHGIGAAVAYAASFSKILLPALRLGTLLAPAAIRRAVLLGKQASDVHSGLIEQYLLDHMLRSEKLAEHLSFLRSGYRLKALTMVEAIKHAAAGLFAFAEPSGGMFVWAEMLGPARDCGDIDWQAFGLRHRVLVIPGSALAANGGGSHIRLSFANPSVAEIGEGIERLAAGLSTQAQGRRRTASN